MQRSLRLAPVLVLLLAAPAAAQSTPSLGHTAPWLGQPLTLTVEGAPAFASVRLLGSEAAGSMPTPYGLLELDRTLTSVVATDSSDASGRVVFVLPVPLDPALAEAERHYQALVQDAGAPAGGVLSEAAHLRLLGARMYVGCEGRFDGHPFGPQAGALLIVSAVTREVVATVDFGVPEGELSPDAQPVFSADMRRGAVMTPDGELLLFDPFFGGALGALPLTGAADRLAADAAGELVFALETGDSSTGAVLHAFELETGAGVGALQLPRSSSGHWCVNPERDEAYVVELDPGGGLPSVRRVALPALADLGALPVGLGPDSEVTQLEHPPGPFLFVTTFDLADCLPDAYGALTRIDYASAPPRVFTLQEPGHVGQVGFAPDRDVLFYRRSFYCSSPNGTYRAARLSAPGPTLSIQPTPSNVDAFPHDVDGDVDRMWVATPTTIDGATYLHWLDLDDLSWTQVFPGAGSGPYEVEVVRDALVAVGCVTLPRGDPTLPSARIAFVDPDTAALEHLDVPSGPESLLGVALPE